MTHSPIRILLVEDSQDCVDLTLELLTKAGILNEIAVARNGKEALAAVKSTRPEIVLLDWVLPDITGSEVLEGIRRIAPETKVIVLSVHLPNSESGGCDSKPDYYISKPIDPIQFIVVLKSIGGFGFSILPLGQDT